MMIGNSKLKSFSSMSDAQVIELSPNIQNHIFSDADNCYALQAMLSNDAVVVLNIQLNAVQVVDASLLSAQQYISSTVSDTEVAKLTIASESLSLRKIAQVLSEVLPTGCVVSIKSNRFSKQFVTQALDVFFSDAVTVDKNKLAEVSIRYRIDIFEKGNAWLKVPGLLVMDMDSTIIAMECIDEIAALAGAKDKVSAVTERAMKGEIPFTQSLYDRVACLQGIALPDLLSIRNRLPFMPNFIATMKVLKDANWKLAVASGGFTFFADYVKQLAQLDVAHSNQLEVKAGKLTGKVIGKVVDGAEKANVLITLAEKFNIPHAQTMAIGDGANDLIMMRRAGTSIAYHAKPTVSAAADSAIRYGGFEGLIFTLK